jgi:hypothetical protein
MLRTRVRSHHAKRWRTYRMKRLRLALLGVVAQVPGLVQFLEVLGQ